MTRRTTTRRLLLVGVVLLAASLVWGLADALAARAPRRRRRRATWCSRSAGRQRARQPQPVRRLGHHDLRDLDDQLQLPVRLQRPDLAPTLGLAAQFPTQANGGISPDGKVWTIHSEAQPQVVGRPAAHRRRRRLHLQLRRQEPHGQHGPHHRRHHERQGDRPDDGGDRLLATQGQHGGHLPADPAQARLGARLTPGRRRRPT